MVRLCTLPPGAHQQCRLVYVCSPLLPVTMGLAVFFSPGGGDSSAGQKVGIVALGTWPRATGQKLMGAELDIWHIMATLFTACP